MKSKRIWNRSYVSYSLHERLCLCLNVFESQNKSLKNQNLKAKQLLRMSTSFVSLLFCVSRFQISWNQVQLVHASVSSKQANIKTRLILCVMLLWTIRFDFVENNPSVLLWRHAAAAVAAFIEVCVKPLWSCDLCLCSNAPLKEGQDRILSWNPLQSGFNTKALVGATMSEKMVSFNNEIFHCVWLWSLYSTSFLIPDSTECTRILKALYSVI